MHRTDAFRIEGTVTRSFPNGTYQVELANGHRLLGFVCGEQKTVSRLRPGQKVNLNLTPYDLSSGRIVIETEKDLI